MDNKPLGYSIKKRKAPQITENYQRSMQYHMSKAQTASEKRAIIEEFNPLFYIFGENRHGIE